ncbi:hypothetical protein Ciccas_002688 [Cichlidogyrus casuarinus]|uniref:Uncharacterized protein n=1 Tax=Cichlidogyrus casuarinus TaxID=1844966 RepID=A0ABD2QGI1_9PLAT
MIGYPLVTSAFFSERILDEEQFLVQFFEEDYIQYQKRVPTGIPFIRGFSVTLQTDLGDIKLEIFVKQAPLASKVSNLRFIFCLPTLA